MVFHIFNPRSNHLFKYMIFCVVSLFISSLNTKTIYVIDSFVFVESNMEENSVVSSPYSTRCTLLR